MTKAFAAPNTALVELQGLKPEIYSLRRDKANAELREAEARRELADLTFQVGLAIKHCSASNCLIELVYMSHRLATCKHCETLHATRFCQ